MGSSPNSVSICLKLGLPSFQNCENKLLLFKSQPFCGLFFMAAWTDGGAHLPCFARCFVVACFISAYFSTHKTLLLLFQAVGIYYALASVYLFFLYVPSVTMFPSPVICLLPTELPSVFLLNNQRLPTRSACRSLCFKACPVTLVSFSSNCKAFCPNLHKFVFSPSRITTGKLCGLS